MTFLKCDFDGAIPADVSARLEMVVRLHRLTVDWIRVDRTRRGYHMVIRVRQRVALARVILLQAILGSDWKREAFNSSRVVRTRNVPAFWRRRINVLYSRHYRGVEL
jgi:hypothetical protein